jgi:hypothetical protein
MAFDSDDGAIEIAEDTGGAGAGGDEGGSDDEIESPTGGEGEGDGSDESDRGRDRRDGTRDDREVDQASRGARELPKQIRAALRELNASNPDFAKQFPRIEKEITGALFKSQQIENLGGLGKVSEALASIEARGGIEGIEAMAADLDAANKFEAALDRGDPVALETWSKESPSGFARTVLPMFEQLGKVNEEKAEQVGSAIVSHIFEKFGAFSVMSALGKALTDGKTEDAVGRFNDLAKFLTDVKRLGGLARTDPHASRSQELDEREQRIATETETAFKSSVRADVNTEVTSKLNQQLRAHLLTLGVRKVVSGTANRMRKEINRELQRVVNSDPNHQRQYEAVMSTHDRARAAKFVIAAAERRLPQVIKDVVRDFNLKGTQPARRGGAPRGDDNRDQERKNVVNGRPKIPEVDFAKTDKATFLASRLHGSAWLKNGRQAKW